MRDYCSLNKATQARQPMATSVPVISGRLRNVLKGLREPKIFLSGMLDIELFDVVVPTAEEWAAVR